MLYSNLVYCYRCCRRANAPIYYKSSAFCLFFLFLHYVCVCVRSVFVFLSPFQFRMFYQFLFSLSLSLTLTPEYFVHRAEKCWIRKCLRLVRQKSFYSRNFHFFCCCCSHTLDNSSSLTRIHSYVWCVHRWHLGFRGTTPKYERK